MNLEKRKLTDKEIDTLWTEVNSLGGFLMQNVEKRRNMPEFFNAIDRLREIERKFKWHGVACTIEQGENK